MNRTPLFIARRLGLESRGERRRSAVGIAVAVIGIALAMVVMMLSVAVMNGFKDEIRRKVTGFEAQITIQIPPPASDLSIDGGSTSLTPLPVELTEPVMSAIEPTVQQQGASVCLAAMRPAILKTDGAFSGIVVRGADRKEGLEFIASHIVEGTMPDYSDAAAKNQIVISRITASELGLSPGDKVSAYFFGDGTARVRNLTVGAVFDTHFSDYDRAAAFSSLALLQGVDKLAANQGTRIELTGLPDAEIENTAQAVQQRLIENLYAGRDSVIYQVDNVHRRGALYFNWLDLLDTNVTVIMIIMALVAGFTLVSSLFIIILERVGMIGILKALGAANAFIRKIFIIMAQRIVIRGMLFGNCIGLAIIYLQSRFRFIPLDPDTYYLSYVPVQISVSDLLWLNFGVIAIATLVLIIPSHAVAKISPARTIRFE